MLVSPISSLRALPASAAVGVAIVEPVTIVRELLTRHVAGLRDHAVVGSYAAAHDLLKEQGGVEPQVVVVGMAGDAAEVLREIAQLRTELPEMPILLFGRALGRETVEGALARGVSGIIDERSGLENLEAAMRALVRGKEFFGGHVPDLIRQLILRRRSNRVGEADLTLREREVLQQLAGGRISKEVAAKLGLSVFTVENVRRRLMRKTGCGSIAELTLHAVRIGLVPIPRMETGVAS